MSSLFTSENPLPKRQNHWLNAECCLANQDKILKSIIISCLPNDVMKYIIKCKTTKEIWNDIILAHEGPSDTEDTKIAALRLKFNAFKSLKGEKVNGTFTRLKCLLNDLENNGVTIPQAEDEESISLEDEGTTKIKAFMAIAEDEPSVGKADARSSQCVDITMKKDYLKRSIWYPDSGCSRHMTGVKQYLYKYLKEPGPKVVFGGDSLGDTKGYGSVKKIKNLNEVRVKELRSDNGTEFKNHKLEEFYDKKGCSTSEDKKWKKQYMLHLVKMMKLFLNLAQKVMQSTSMKTDHFLMMNSLNQGDSVSPEEPPKLTSANDHPTLNKLDQPESPDNLESVKIQYNVTNEPFSDVQPSPIISPSKLIEALEDKGWIIAMQEELNQFERNKYEGIDYEETFAPLARLKISEEVYVQQPPGFETSEFPNHVCKLDKSLYGLKQAPRAWYETLSKFLIQHKFVIDYAGCNLDRKSTSGACQILGGKLVCWSAKKQSSMAMSSAKAEYVTVVGCCAQVLWIKSQLADYDVLYDKVPIFCDNTSGIAISNNLVLHFRTKHIDIMYHFIRNHILNGDIELHFVPTDLLLADIFTKPLVEPSFTRLDAELVHKLQNRKKNREENIRYTRFLSLIFEKLLGENYINDALTFVKLYTILDASFQKPLAYEVALTSHMLKVAKLFQEPGQSFILSSEKVNVDDDADKSLSKTTVQPITQPKAPTDLKPQKKRIPPSSKPKSSYKIRVILPKKQVTKTQYAEETVVIADATQSREDSESVKDQINKPKTAEAEKIMDEIDQKNKAAQEKPESPYDTELDIKIIKSSVRPLYHLHEELSTLNTKVDQLESNISKKVTDDIQSFVPSIVADNLKANLPGLLSEALKNTFP
ncbi:retrovirus-related pol polyprotein from transposon TNT 1-94 [Tanacetum coccineum]